jgi:ankyrin repeat protein
MNLENILPLLDKDSLFRTLILPSLWSNSLTGQLTIQDLWRYNLKDFEVVKSVLSLIGQNQKIKELSLPVGNMLANNWSDPYAYDAMILRFQEYPAFLETYLDFILPLDLKTKNRDQYSAIFAAVKLGDIKALGRLKEKKFDFSLKDTTQNTLLHLATETGSDNQELIEFLLSAIESQVIESQLNAIDSQDKTALVKALEKGYPKSAESLIKKMNKDGLNLRTINYRNTPLLLACKKGYMELASLLMVKEADINLMGYGRMLPIHYLVRHPDCLKILEDMFRKDPSFSLFLDEKNDGGYNPFFEAINAANIKIAEFLLSKKPGLLNVANHDGKTPLCEAVSLGKKETIQYLLEQKGIDIDQADKKGQTPLLIAIEQKNQLLIDQLLEKGADVNKTDKKGETPLFIAVRKGNKAIMNKLLEKQANIAHQNQEKQTALYFAKDPEIQKLLLKENILNLNHQDQHGQTALLFAVSQKYPDGILEGLITSENINMQDKSGVAPILWAVFNQQLKTTQLFLEKGAHINAFGYKKNTPGHIAIDKQDLKIFELLLASGLDINAVNDYGESLLYQAVRQRGQGDCFNVLMKNPNIKVDIPNTEGETPLENLIQFFLRQDEKERRIECLINKGARVTPSMIEKAKKRKLSEGIIKLLEDAYKEQQMKNAANSHKGW